MTEPAPALRHRRVLAIALPIVLSNATVPILGAVDTGVVGQLGQAAPIGAVGIGAIIITGFYWLFGFLRMGTTGLTSQARGAGNRAEVSAMLSRALMIGLAAGLAMIALRGPLFWAAFQLSPASAEVERMARAYMGIRVWSAPAAVSRSRIAMLTPSCSMRRSRSSMAAGFADCPSETRAHAVSSRLTALSGSCRPEM